MKKIFKVLMLICIIFGITLFSVTVFASSNNLYSNKFVQVDSGKTVIAGVGSTSYSYGLVTTTVQVIGSGTKKTKAIIRRCSSSACSSFSKSVSSSSFNLGSTGSVVITTMGYIGSGYWQGKYQNSNSYADWEGYSTLQGSSISNNLS